MCTPRKFRWNHVILTFTPTGWAHRKHSSADLQGAERHPSSLRCRSEQLSSWCPKSRTFVKLVLLEILKGHRCRRMSSSLKNNFRSGYLQMPSFNVNATFDSKVMSIDSLSFPKLPLLYPNRRGSGLKLKILQLIKPKFSKINQ